MIFKHVGTIREAMHNFLDRFKEVGGGRGNLVKSQLLLFSHVIGNPLFLKKFMDDF